MLSSSLIYTSYVTRKLISYGSLKIETKEKDKDLTKLGIQTNRLINSLNEIVESENKIRRMLGLKTDELKLDLDPNGRRPAKDKVQDKLKVLNREIRNRRAGLRGLLGTIEEMRRRFANTPSIWPAYGKITSTFGYRVFPWRGFHTGVDISNKYGTHISSTAAGIVSYAGWMTGYGKAVVVDHGYGLQTLYGHCSGFAVRPGQKVEKGQFIAYMGATGYATGNHVHYEVIKNGVKINPMNYLNLNLFGAILNRRADKMGIFDFSKAEQSQHGLIGTMIGTEATIRGEIDTKGSVRVDGSMEGTIKASTDIFVAEKATIKGNVFAKRVVVAGEIHGDVSAEESVEIKKNGRVLGNIAGQQAHSRRGRILQRPRDDGGREE